MHASQRKMSSYVKFKEAAPASFRLRWRPEAVKTPTATNVTPAVPEELPLKTDELQALWREFFDAFRATIHPSTAGFLEGLIATSFEADVLTLSARTDFMANVIRETYLTTLEEVLGQFWPGSPRPQSVKVIFDAEAAKALAPTNLGPLFGGGDDRSTAQPDLEVVTPTKRSVRPAFGSPLHREMGFDNFLSDNSNEEAFYGANRFAELDASV